MAIPMRAIVLICILGYVGAQYSETENLPQRTGGSPKPRYRLQNPRPAPGPGPHQLQTTGGVTRPRRPLIPLSRPRPSPTTDGPQYPISFNNARPRPVYVSPLAVKTAHIPSAAKEQQNVQQEHKQQQQQQQEKQQQSELQSVKPVSEDPEEEQDVAQAIVNLGAVSSFSPQSGNLVSGPLTPKPELGYATFRGGSPTPQLARPAPLPEQNIAPVQYRPAQKPLKIRKPIIEEVPEIRVTPRQQQPLLKTAQPKIADTRERYSEPRDKYSDNREKYTEPREKYTESRDKYHSGSREKKPVAQIIRRWREDNDDGSITWGFENDDGSFKEELIGIDCITRGKYGYIDLDGFRREYSYETGIKCDEEEQQDERDNGFVDYQENKLVFPNGKTIDLSSMGKKQTRRPQPIYN